MGWCQTKNVEALPNEMCIQGLETFARGCQYGLLCGTTNQYNDRELYNWAPSPVCQPSIYLLVYVQLLFEGSIYLFRKPKDVNFSWIR